MRTQFYAWMTAALVASGSATAQGFFLPATDSRLRDDLSLLVDEGVLNLPVNEWPLVREDVARAARLVDVNSLHDSSLRASLNRVLARTTAQEDADEWRVREIGVTAGKSGLLRDEATLGRDNFELKSVGGASTDRYSATLAATGVIDPKDNQSIRFDGSEVTVRWGNWLLGANQMERWWGPGRDGNLIFSTNARPMPSISLDRYRSLPVGVPGVRWLGPWRFSGFLALMENERPDVDRPVFMGMRLSFKPAPIFELGLSRTAQFCGKRRHCNLSTFGRVLIGQDNPGYRGLDDPADEPGNQMAGIDVRIVSPVKALPFAVHAQMIGEDNSSTGIPERYLAQFGAETWVMRESGAVFRAHVEYANTSCKWYAPSTNTDCAYRQAVFFAGYRYRGRNIGHTTDADATTTSLALSLTQPQGGRWAVLMRSGKLDAYGSPDPFNPLSEGRSKYKSAQVSWEDKVKGQAVGAQIGYEHQSLSSGHGASGAFGFIQWRKPL
jgi:hypothetical protein